jgi:hypothetical protein
MSVKTWQPLPWPHFVSCHVDLVWWMTFRLRRIALLYEGTSETGQGGGEWKNLGQIQDR